MAEQLAEDPHWSPNRHADADSPQQAVGHVDRVGNLRSDVREMGEPLRNVEIQFAKVDQRLLTLERAIIPAADSDE